MILRAFEGVGIELEYMLVARPTLDVVPCADELLAAMAGAPASDVVRGELGWSNELVRHVMELKNVVPACTLGDIAEGFATEIAVANRCLASQDRMLLGSGMHPWMDPRTQTALWTASGEDIYATFDRLFDCRRHGWANLQSMHVNLPFGDDEEFVRLHAAVRALLPLVPALAASSPYCEGARAPELDHRLAVYANNAERVPEITGAVVPEMVDAPADYRARILAPIYRAMEPLDPQGALRHEWINARGAIARFDRQAIEIRLADVQECPQVDLAIAAALVSATRLLYEERWRPMSTLRALSTARLAAILHAVVRDAEHARIDDGEYLAAFGLNAPLSAGALWEHVLAAADGMLDDLLPASSATLSAILHQGTLARRLVAAAGASPGREALRETYAELARCLEAGRMFRA